MSGRRPVFLSRRRNPVLSRQAEVWRPGPPLGPATDAWCKPEQGPSWLYSPHASSTVPTKMTSPTLCRTQQCDGSTRKRYQ